MWQPSAIFRADSLSGRPGRNGKTHAQNDEGVFRALGSRCRGLRRVECAGGGAGAAGAAGHDDRTAETREADLFAHHYRYPLE
jgi:hypothetical protein